MVEKLDVISKSETPPFTIETETDGGEELRMKYRYLDIRRDPIRENLIFRHKVTLEIRNFLSNANFIDVETPCLIKSTPEGLEILLFHLELILVNFMLYLNHLKLLNNY